MMSFSVLNFAAILKIFVIICRCYQGEENPGKSLRESWWFETNFHFLKVHLWFCWSSVSFAASPLLTMGSHWRKIHYFLRVYSEISCSYLYHRIKASVQIYSRTENLGYSWTKNILNHKSQTNIDCIRLNPGNEMVQTPMSCLDTMDKALLTLSFLSILGVGFGLFVACKYGNKVFNQSHSSGRDATIWMGNIDKTTACNMQHVQTSF